MISSDVPSRVPVKNIYYMLVYAWNHPYETNSIPVYEQAEKDLLNLLSRVLLVKVKALIKKGFYKDYVQVEDVSSIIRGKILFKESIGSFSNKRGKMYIQDEEMTYDILHNQIIKTTLFYLASHPRVESEIKDEIKSTLTYFSRVSIIEMSLNVMKNIHLHRNNQHYQFILNICQFIWEDVLIHEGESQKKFQDFSREHQQMARLFENFVKNFYRKEIPGSVVRSESLYWPAEGAHTEFLPIMKTDISLEFSGEKYIMDTKFYKDMFKTQWEKETVRSSHLYQLFSYLKSDEYYNKRKAKGILLYPKVHQSIDLAYRIHGFDMKLCTLDLTQDWRLIHKRLLEILGCGEGLSAYLNLPI